MITSKANLILKGEKITSEIVYEELYIFDTHPYNAILISFSSLSLFIFPVFVAFSEETTPVFKSRFTTVIFSSFHSSVQTKQIIIVKIIVFYEREVIKLADCLISFERVDVVHASCG